MSDTVPAAEATQSHKSFLQYDTFAESLHKAILESITLADQKSVVISSLFAFTFIMLLNPTNKIWPDEIGCWLSRHYLFLAAITSLFAAEVFAFFAIHPRLKSASRNVLFWKTISEHSDSAAYVSAIAQLDPEDLVKRKLEHCHELSLICARKYGVLRIAIYFAALAIVLFFIGTFIPALVPPRPLPGNCDTNAAAILPVLGCQCPCSPQTARQRNLVCPHRSAGAQTQSRHADSFLARSLVG